MGQKELASTNTSVVDQHVQAPLRLHRGECVAQSQFVHVCAFHTISDELASIVSEW